MYLFMGLFMKAWKGMGHLWHVTTSGLVAASLSCAGPDHERPSLRNNVHQARNCKTLHTWLRRPCKFYDRSLCFLPASEFPISDCTFVIYTYLS